MEFNKKLQALRKQKGLTQEQLSDRLFVSRTAVSKWESGKGYPSIDSLKQIAIFFEITVDDLLSSNEILNLAQKESEQKENNFRDLVFGLLDVSMASMLFLPLFAQKLNGTVNVVSLLSLSGISGYLKIAFLVLVFAVILIGLLTLTLQNCEYKLWLKAKTKLSVILNILCVVLLTLCRQPYPALLSLIFLMIKAPFFFKKQ